jgi:two-component system response regulator FixJ
LTSSDIVHVIDDDADVRQSLAFLLSTAGMPVRVYDSANAFLKTLSQAQAGCVVSDVRMPGIDGIELKRRLAVAGVDLPVILITGHGDVALAVEAMKAGAVDFIEKPFDDALLIAAIQAALARGDSDRSRKTEIALIQERLELLSQRERQVLQGLVAGKPNKVIGFDLAISPRTVEIYRANVMTKMNANSLSALVRMSLLAGVPD